MLRPFHTKIPRGPGSSSTRFLVFWLVRTYEHGNRTVITRTQPITESGREEGKGGVSSNILHLFESSRGAQIYQDTDVRAKIYENLKPTETVAEIYILKSDLR